MLTKQQFFASLGMSHHDVYVVQLGEFLDEYRIQTTPVLKALVLVDILKWCTAFWRHEKETLHDLPHVLPPVKPSSLPESPVTVRKRSNNVKMVAPVFAPLHNKVQRSNALSAVQLNDGSATHATFVRKRAITAVETAVAAKLCKIFGCTPNVLPHFVEERFSVSVNDVKKSFDLARMTKEDLLRLGETQLASQSTVKRSTAVYLEAEAAAKFKVTFRGGLAYVLKVSGNSVAESIADTSDYLGDSGAESRQARYGNGSITPSHRKWCYGYVFTDQGLFMADHNLQENANQAMFYHSSYMKGGAVICAGDISFFKGKVTSISTFSGHYTPELKMILPVLRYLQTKQVDLERVSLVDAAEYGDMGDVGAASAQDMFKLDPSSILFDTSLSYTAAEYLRDGASKVLKPRRFSGLVPRK